MASRKQIEALILEAGEAGDYEGAQLYKQALEGNLAALGAVEKHLAWVAAQEVQ